MGAAIFASHEKTASAQGTYPRTKGRFRMPVVMQWDSNQVRQIASLVRKASQHVVKSRDEIGHSLTDLPRPQKEGSKDAVICFALQRLAELSQRLLNQEANLLTLVLALEKADGIICQADRSLLLYLRGELLPRPTSEEEAGEALFFSAAASNAAGGAGSFQGTTAFDDPGSSSLPALYRSAFGQCTYPLPRGECEMLPSTVSVLALQIMEPLSVPNWLMGRIGSSNGKEDGK